MTSGAWFILLITLVPLVLLIYHVGNPIKYFRTVEGRGAAKGIAIVLLALSTIVLLGGCASQGRFATEAYIFGGLDYTKNDSPMCVDRRGTSNIGAGVTVWETTDKRTSVAAQYTHHSCFVGVDSASYDALGLTVRRSVWAR